MNISHLLLCTALLAAPVCMAQDLTEPETEAPSAASQLPAPGAENSRGRLCRAANGTPLLPPEGWGTNQIGTKLLQDKQYRHLLDIHELLRVTGPDSVKAVFSKSPQDAAFIKAFYRTRHGWNST